MILPESRAHLIVRLASSIISSARSERNGSTRVHIQGEGEPHGLARMAGGLMARRARQEFETDFGRFKSLLESRPRA